MIDPPDDLAPHAAPLVPGWLFWAATVFCLAWMTGSVLHAALQLLEALTQ